jgi:hypothetical protein
MLLVLASVATVIFYPAVAPGALGADHAAGARAGLPSVVAGRAVVPAAGGSSYYVSPSGNDGNPGTQSEPWLTVDHAASVAAAGDTVNVEPGAYSLGAQLTLGNSGTAAAPITFVSTVPHGAQVTLTPDSTADRVVEIDGDYVTWDGFDVTAPNYSYGRLGIITYGTGDAVTGNYVHDIARTVCTDATSVHGGAGIDVTTHVAGYPTATHAVIDSNLVERIGPATAGLQCDRDIQGVYISTPSNTVINNIISTVSGIAIQAFHNPNYEVIANNDMDHAGFYGVLVGCALDPTAGDLTAVHNLIVNNIARDNAGVGFREYKDSNPDGTYCTVSNNQFENNDSYNNGGGEYGLYPDDQSTYTGGIDADPLYVDYVNGDYHLQAGSPAIDSGTSTGAPGHDYAGTPRPQGAGYDTGAYEYVP